MPIHVCDKRSRIREESLAIYECNKGHRVRLKEVDLENGNAVNDNLLDYSRYIEKLESGYCEKCKEYNMRKLK